MKNSNIKRLTFIVGIIAIIMCVVLCGCRTSEQPDTPEQPKQQITEETGEENGIAPQPVEEKNSEVDKEVVKVEEDADFGNMMLSDALSKIKNIQMGKEEDQGFLATDIMEYLFVGPSDMERTLYYDLTDLNGDGYRELIIGGGYDDGTISPLGVYMYKDDQLYLPDLSYFVGILSDGTVHTYQGNGVPDEDHKDGYYFKIDTSADDGIVEVGPSSAEKKEFNWKQF